MAKVSIKNEAHRIAAEMLYQLFELTISLDKLTIASFRNTRVRQQLSVVGKGLRSLRRELHVEFCSRAAFDETSPYSGFEARLVPESKDDAAPADPSPLS